MSVKTADHRCTSRVWRWTGSGMVQEDCLWEALGLPRDVPVAAAITGAGGKTSAMYVLASEAAVAGRRVLAVTSTHIRIPDGLPLMVWPEDAEAGPAMAEQTQELIRRLGGLRRGEYLVAGRKAEGGKLRSLPPKVYDRLKRLADVILVEADGARGLPFKIPRHGEPVIPAWADAVITCAGLDAVGHPVKELCFGWEEAEDRGFLEGDLTGELEITPDLIARILLHGQGGRKGAGGRMTRILLNKADDPKREDLGRRVARGLEQERRRQGEQGDFACAMTTFREITYRKSK